MRITVDGRAGFGTSEPRQRVHAKEAIASGLDFESAGTITLYPPDGFASFHLDNGPAGGRPTGRLRISFGGEPGDVEVVCVTQDSRVGVGTQAPLGTFHVASSATSDVPQVAITSNAPKRLRAHPARSVCANPVTKIIGAWRDWDIAAGAGQLHFFVPSAGDVMAMTEQGDVGIGTDTPASKLEVKGVATVQVLDITGGADIAEIFCGAESERPEPGTVMVIDETSAGGLRISTTAQDPKVVGIVSGDAHAGPAIRLNKGSDSGVCVALVGRVPCKADARLEPIRVGDLLSTSDLPGYAMRTSQPTPGTVLGKAMTALPEGTGTVIALVSLQ